MNHWAISGLLTGVSSLFFGLFVYWKERSKATNQIFCLFAIAVAAYGFSILVIATEDDPNFALLKWRLAWTVGSIWTPPLFYHFVCTFLSLKRSKLIATHHTIAVLFTFLTWTPIHISGVRYVFDQFYYITPGPSFPVFFLWWASLALLAHYELLKAYRIAEGLRREQINTFFLATLIGYTGGTLAFLPIFGIDLYPVGTYAIPFCILIMAYGILQYSLFDIRIILRKSLIYSSLVTCFTVFFFAFVMLVERFFQIRTGYQSFLISLLTFAIIGFTFQPLRLWIQRFLDLAVYHAPQEELVRRMDRLEKEAQQTEKLKAVSTLAAGLSHELRNPLQAILTHAEFLPERYDDPEFRERCSKIMKTEIARINDLLNQLMNFAKPKQPVLRAVEPHKILDSTFDFLNNEFVKRNIKLEKLYKANGARIQADPDQIRQVILNLALNAIQAIGKEGHITINTYRDNGWFTFEIKDSGPGIHPKILPKLFEPFNSMKSGGVGLGLSIVHSIIKEHRGNVSVQSRRGEGANFVVKLPSESDSKEENGHPNT